MTKTCKDCGMEKPFEDFGKAKKMLDGRRSECKKCRNIYEKSLRDGNTEYKNRQLKNRKNWAKSNPDKYLEGKRKYRENVPSEFVLAYRKKARRKNLEKYGLTPKKYNDILREQGYSCKICKSSENNKSQDHFHVDHCHDSGIVRGLLCNKCNMGLGLFNDDANLLQTALEYLEEFMSNIIISSNGMTEEDLDNMAKEEELKRRKELYFAKNGTNDI